MFFFALARTCQLQPASTFTNREAQPRSQLRLEKNPKLWVRGKLVAQESLRDITSDVELQPLRAAHCSAIQEIRRSYVICRSPTCPCQSFLQRQCTFSAWWLFFWKPGNISRLFEHWYFFRKSFPCPGASDSTELKKVTVAGNSLFVRCSVFICTWETIFKFSEKVFVFQQHTEEMDFQSFFSLWCVKESVSTCKVKNALWPNWGCSVNSVREACEDRATANWTIVLAMFTGCFQWWGRQTGSSAFVGNLQDFTSTRN